MNQSELEANTCNRRQARENACEQVATGLSFTSDWSRSGARFFNQSQSEVKQNANYFRHSIENRSKTYQETFLNICTHKLGHENPHSVFSGSLLEAIVAKDANIDLIKCSKI